MTPLIIKLSLSGLQHSTSQFTIKAPQFSLSENISPIETILGFMHKLPIIFLYGSPWFLWSYEVFITSHEEIQLFPFLFIKENLDSCFFFLDGFLACNAVPGCSFRRRHSVKPSLQIETCKHIQGRSDHTFSFSIKNTGKDGGLLSKVKDVI